MYSVLSQLNIDFETEYSPEWVKPKRFDFYIPSLNLIIEMDGGWHYKDNSLNNKSKEESESIDKLKDMICKQYNLDVIRINCDYKLIKNRFNYIKQNILNSELRKYLNLDNVSWELCDSDSVKNIIKIACDYYEKNINMKIVDMADNLNISYNTFVNYLKTGNNFGWCSYDINRRGRKIKVVETGDIFESITDCSRKSEEIYGVKFTISGINNVINGGRKHHKNYHFECI